MNHVKSGLRISNQGMAFDPSTGESYTLNKSGLAILKLMSEGIDASHIIQVLSQGHNGSLTHQSDWRFAWDFVREGSDGRTFSGDGSGLSDYLCYGKPVFPSADGVVESVVDGIPDNKPGDSNTRQNWGNTVVVRHAAGLYSKNSHLKPGTIRVKTGDYILTGMELAQAGNSGRSPVPHLHFQFQAEPNIDASTIDYPFGYYLLDNNGRRSLRTYDRPSENDIVSNLIPVSGNNPLFSIFLACFRVPLAFDRQVSVTDQLPLSIVTKSWIRWLQDWIAPFYIFLQSDFSLNFLEADDALDPSFYILTSRINRKFSHRSMDLSEFRIQINHGGNMHIHGAGKGSLELTTLNR